MNQSWFLLLLVLPWAQLCSGVQSGSSFAQMPFLTVWNAPTSNCLSQFNIDLDLGIFNIMQNQNQVFLGDNITIFYADKLGLYPRYNGNQGKPVNGGVPQNSSLDKHLRAASDNISVAIPRSDFQGLAVVDWESWRPVWERNWDAKQIYWKGSRAVVRAKHPDWSPEQVETAARIEFEKSAQQFMEETLRLGHRERPDGLWGFYGFPNCYNYFKGSNYTGECPEVDQKRNDELFWLWNASSALYPDIYLSLPLQNMDKEVYLYSHHRILEAMRVASQATPHAPAVFPYARIVYTYSFKFLSKDHLVFTIGESAALGAAGVILWGEHIFSKSKAQCEDIKSYIDETLGPYLVNVTSAAALCSQTLCSSRGRCSRRSPSSGLFLHLDPEAWKIQSYKRPTGRGRDYKVLGQLRSREVALMKGKFRCNCYAGWRGARCAKRTKVSLL